MTTFYIVIAAVVLLGALLLNKQAGKKRQKIEYRKRSYLLSLAERSFYGVLDQAIGAEFKIMSKVRLSDVVEVKQGQGNSAWTTGNNKIQRKHVDFVLCDPKSLAIKAVIELDDKSHLQDNRRDRDDFVDEIFASAGLPVCHFIAKNAYSLEEIKARLSSALAPAPVK